MSRPRKRPLSLSKLTGTPVPEEPTAKTPGPAGEKSPSKDALTASADEARKRLREEVERTRSELNRVILAEGEAREADVETAVSGAEQRIRAELENQIATLRRGFDMYATELRSELESIRGVATDQGRAATAAMRTELDERLATEMRQQVAAIRRGSDQFVTDLRAELEKVRDLATEQAREERERAREDRERTQRRLETGSRRTEEAVVGIERRIDGAERLAAEKLDAALDSLRAEIAGREDERVETLRSELGERLSSSEDDWRSRAEAELQGVAERLAADAEVSLRERQDALATDAETRLNAIVEESSRELRHRVAEEAAGQVTPLAREATADLEGRIEAAAAGLETRIQGLADDAGARLAKTEQAASLVLATEQRESEQRLAKLSHDLLDRLEEVRGVAIDGVAQQSTTGRKDLAESVAKVQRALDDFMTRRESEISKRLSDQEAKAAESLSRKAARDRRREERHEARLSAQDADKLVERATKRIDRSAQKAVAEVKREATRQLDESTRQRQETEKRLEGAEKRLSDAEKELAQSLERNRELVNGRLQREMEAQLDALLADIRKIGR